MSHSLRFPLLLVALLALTGNLAAQDWPRFVRLYIKDKGTPARVLLPGDPMYAAATAGLTERAMRRRAKVLPSDSLVSTDDLPLFGPYIDAITATGAVIFQRSRWLNTVMVRTDSATYFDRLVRLPFLDSARIARTYRVPKDPMEKPSLTDNIGPGTPPWSPTSSCITDHYGFSAVQNRLIDLDAAHEIGIAGDGVLVGILDAGFNHMRPRSLHNARVIAEHDFVFGDDNAADEPGENGAETHGTDVMSIIGAWLPDTLVGGAPQVSFVLAKTEDIRSEKNIEEDNFVAGLEWVEAQGADVTNTSLGYTTFDTPEQGHPYEDLNGHTAFASRGLNHCVSLGVVCVVAAGNEGGKYNYVSVPAEADSAIAAAAVDSTEAVATFSSRGFSGRARIKPDVAALGVRNWVADHSDSTRLKQGQGTSYASPMVTASVALILSARPSLTPYQVRQLLYHTSSHALNPDTAVGYGVVNIGRALQELSRTLPVVGTPTAILEGDAISISAWSEYHGELPQSETPPTDDGRYLELTLSRPGAQGRTMRVTAQPVSGLAHWIFPRTIGDHRLVPGDSVLLRFSSSITGDSIRTYALLLTGDGSLPASTLCFKPLAAATGISAPVPNPFSGMTSIQFQINERAPVTLAIYNALGDEVARLIDGATLDPGIYRVPFVPSALAAGAYYYTLRTGDDVTSGAMVYIP
jgi:hypothetical protein